MPSSADYTISLPYLPINMVSSFHLPCFAVNCADGYYVVKQERIMTSLLLWRKSSSALK